MLASSIKQIGNVSRKNKYNVYFQDEGRFGRMGDPVYCWSKKGYRPSIAQQRIREYTYAYSAINPYNGDVFSLVLPYANTECMQLFMDEFSKHVNGAPTLLIMDQASWHTTKSLNSKKNIILEYQPPYSPELNPVEHFWKYLRKKYMNNNYWESIEEVENVLANALYLSTKERDVIRSLSLFSWMNTT